MTSKHLFFKAMREDLKHKTWMLALSVLGSFLILPVAWLIYRNNMGYSMESVAKYQYLVRDTLNFFEEYLGILGGCFSIAGAIIVGLFGFRYVHHKNMIDTWHSLPIKRDTLFAACWLNGFLLWLVPFFTGLVLTCLMAGGFILKVGSVAALGTMLTNALTSFATLTVIFLLVYNLILVAVMLSGNILNTLVSMAVLGVGVISIYGLSIAFFEMYMSTFYSGALSPEKVTYASPLFAAGYLMYARIEYMEELGRMWGIIGLNFVISLALGVGSWYLYRRRASELAEQGIKNKPLTALMKIIVGVAAGMAGWLLLVLLTAEYNVIWGIFGCILVCVVVFGIMDIIFHMDFKAFFASKLQMAVTTAVALLLCFAFYFDWVGYDNYLPEKEDVVEIAIYDSNLSNRYFYGGRMAVLDDINIRDVDAAYAFLERMVTDPVERVGGDVRMYYQQVPVKVTLDSGRSYYRYYKVTPYDGDVFWPLVMSPEYLEKTYVLDEDEMQYCDMMHFERRDMYQSVKNASKEDMVAIMEAYNRDLQADPKGVMLGPDRLFVEITVDIDTPDDYYEVYLDVYENMHNTIAAMKAAGYGELVEEVPAEEISEIILYLGYQPRTDATPEQVIAMARNQYGVYAPGQTAADVQMLIDDYYKYYDYEYYEEPVEYDVEVIAQTIAVAELDEEPRLVITDKAEIEELLALMSYTPRYRNNSVFHKDTMSIPVVFEGAGEERFYIMRGALPEKYILRFGELDLSQYKIY